MTLPNMKAEPEAADPVVMDIRESFPMPVPLEDMMPRFEGWIRSHEASWIEYRLALDVMDLKREVADLKRELEVRSVRQGEVMNDQMQYQPVNAAEDAQMRIANDVVDHLVQMEAGTAIRVSDLAIWISETHERDLDDLYPGFHMNSAYDIASRVFWRTGIGRELFDSSIVDGEFVHVRRPA